MNWVMFKKHYPEELGCIPGFLSEDDPRPAREQLDAHYRHGGGWRPQAGFTMKEAMLVYPGDPPFKPIAYTKLRDEMVLVYRYGYVAILQRDKSFEVCRMD